MATPTARTTCLLLLRKPFKPFPSIPHHRASYSTTESGLHAGYFTGNPKYYDALIKVNNLIKSRGGLPTSTTQNIKNNPMWMTLDDIKATYGYRMDELTYNSFIAKLNVLYQRRFVGDESDGLPQADTEITTLLQRFVKLGRDISIQPPPPPTLDAEGKSYAYASRKTAKAQAWILAGDGAIYINGIPMGDYFKSALERDVVMKPLVAGDVLGKYNIWCLAKGGGLAGQAGAVMVAVARALVVHEPALGEAFKQAELTKVDTRQVERKKTGLPKARKRYTWVKR
ncbi:hypothetical protein SmJEL517_g01733 [Synchytrium microbalum]|uniref:Small ribosomal subunit protein uS9m n=1 Tax=Synchytrium microbalum TaxID=1806994 RepID=A0A507CE50_9FUNG|nr:uncharacterized protein SmJEL517_g01733 [Synchytrium microbalum]TPX35855.1 hypothetical protein SmJEL517_g01733 [Synchytrium microbalum]